MSGTLFKELKRRKLFKVGAAYLVVAWLAVQACSIGFPAFDAPPWALRIFILVALLGFPVALVLAWVLETTPEGVQLDPAQKGTKRVVLVAVALSALALAWYFKGQPAFRAEPSAAIATAGRNEAAVAKVPAVSAQSIAVLPFENLSADPDNAFFATGIQDEILTSLAKVGGLKVISRTSTIRYGAKPPNLSAIAAELGVANILEGSVQRVGNNVRVNVQLIDARTDTHTWAETYDRSLEDVFAVQSEVAQTIGPSRPRWPSLRPPMPRPTNTICAAWRSSCRHPTTAAQPPTAAFASWERRSRWIRISRWLGRTWPSRTPGTTSPASIRPRRG